MTPPADDRSVNVHEWGPASSPDVVFFWHGAEHHAGANVGEIARLLATEGVRVIALDAPGFGRSPADLDADPVRLARLAVDVVAARYAAPAIFVGHSWGAHIACWAGAESPSTWRGLFLLDGGFFDFTELFARRAPDPGDAPTEVFADWAEYFAHLRVGRRRWTTAQESMYRTTAHEDAAGRIHPISTGPTSRAVTAGVVNRPTSASWARIATAGLPVRVLLSTEPADAVARRQDGFLAAFATALPDAGIESIPGATHEIVDDAAEAIADRLNAFLDATRVHRSMKDA